MNGPVKAAPVEGSYYSTRGNLIASFLELLSSDEPGISIPILELISIWLAMILRPISIYRMQVFVV